MAFSDDFTGSAGQLLSARAGWTFGGGEDRLAISTSGTTLAKVSPTTTAAYNPYYRPDDGLTSQAVGADLFTGAACPFVLGSGNSPTTFNGYVLRYQSATSARVYKVTNGVLAGAPITGLNVTTLADTLALELRSQVVSPTQVNLQMYSHGAQVGSGSDTSSPFTSGRRGITTASTAASTSILDNYFDNYTAGANLVLTPRASRFFATAPMGTSQTVTASGTFTTTPTSIEARLVDSAGNAVPGFDWTVKVASPSGNTFAFSWANVPLGGPYTRQVRDSAVPSTVAADAAGIFVAPVAVLWGQSQNQKLASDGLGTVTPTTGMKVFHVSLNQGTKANPGVTTLREVATQAAQLGSGIVAMANQWHADTGGLPLLLVDCTYGGTTIEQWINDSTGPVSGVMLGWGLWSGVAATSLGGGDNQASTVMFMQGTSNVSTTGDAAAANDYRTKMATLRGKFLTALPGQAPLFAVVPHQRSIDGPNTYRLRAAQYAQSISGGDWRTLCWLLDWQMDGDASPHQVPSVTGNIRGGRRIGRGLAKLLFSPALDVSGPQIASADFTDSARQAIDVTWDRDIATAASSGHFVSTNDGGSFPLLSNVTTTIVSARVIRLTSTGSPFPLGTTRYDILRDEPFSSNSADPSRYVGPESAMETDFLSKVVRDTTGFDGGRGMPASPVMGTGMPVALPIVLAPTNATGSVTVRVRQAT